MAGLLILVGLAVILYVIRQSNRVVVKQWVFDDGEAMPRETAAPAALHRGRSYVLVPYGSLFFAAAPVMESQLPEVPPRADGVVVIIRLRGKDEIGSTFLKVLEGYAVRVAAAGGAVMVAGVSSSVLKQLRVTGALKDAEKTVCSSNARGWGIRSERLSMPRLDGGMETLIHSERNTRPSSDAAVGRQ